MKIRVLIVSGKRHNRNSLGLWLELACQEVNELRLEATMDAKTVAEAIGKVDDADINVIICDYTLVRWEDLEGYFRNIGRRLFYLFSPENTGVTQVMIKTTAYRVFSVKELKSELLKTIIKDLTPKSRPPEKKLMIDLTGCLTASKNPRAYARGSLFPWLNPVFLL